jgi:SAM-dependent methyltransferase
VVQFPDLYDEIAPLYHLVYPDWEASIERQAAALDALFIERLGPGPFSIRDVSCGIGTQALGLARLGHRVTASDLSGPAVARGREEAARRGLEIDFSVADMRRADERPGTLFDVVLSADNAVPHLLSDREISAAFQAFFRCTRPGGICAISVRDYASEDRSTPQLRPYGIRTTATGRYLVFQTWDFDGDQYHVTMYFLQEKSGGGFELTAGRSRYYAVGLDTLGGLLADAGFADVERLDGRFFQPVLIGRRPVV